MKKLIIISAIAMNGLVYNTANAQIGIHVGIHLFPHKIFVPRPEVVVQADAPVYHEQAVSDNNDCDFYYLPDVGAYYSVNEQCYYYLDGDNWISAAYLPGVYRDYDWRNARRFEIREARPYLHNDVYVQRYRGFNGDLAHNQDHFRGGFNGNYSRNAYNAPQHFDNRRDSNQQFDNRGNNRHFDNGNQNNYAQNNAGYNRDNNHGGQQFNQNHDRGANNGQKANPYQNHDKDNRNTQQHIAQNNMGYDGHNNGNRDRF